MKRFKEWLSHPWLPVVATLLAVGLMFPSLWNGLILDDYFHRLVLLEDPHSISCASSPLNLFCFSNGNPEENRQMMNSGFLPWYTQENFQICFLRPLSAISHWLDYLIWPEIPFLMHVHNLIWFAIFLILVAFFYKRILGVTWVAGLAILFFAVDDTHGNLVGWIANRNAIIAGVFGILCLIIHDRWRRENYRSGAFFGPICFALSILSAEAGIAIAAYLLAYALFLEDGSLHDRITSLIPYGCIIFSWGLIYFVFGYGSICNPLYVDPIKEPLSYIVALYVRAPVYLLSQWATPPSFAYMFWPSIMHRAGLIIIVLLALILTPLIRRNRIAQFWTLGMVLSLLPICSSRPDDRNLLFVGLGAMGLLAQWFSWLDQFDWKLKSTLWRVFSKTILILFFLIHLVLAPVSLVVSATGIVRIDQKVEQVSRGLPSGPEFKNKKYVIINNPVPTLFVLCVFAHRAVRGEYTPLIGLADGESPLIIKRIDPYTIDIRAEKGSITGYDIPFVKKNNRFSMSGGQKVELKDMTIDVLEVEEGLPSAVKFRFSVPLEDASLVWFHWQDNGYVPFTPPAIGETINFEGARFTMG